MRYLTFLFLLITIGVQAQKGIVRGNVYDKDSGEPIGFCNVFLEGTTYGNTTDVNGFFTISEVPAGQYRLVAQFIGYDTSSVEINLKDGAIVFENLYLKEGGIQLEGVEVSARKDQARTTVAISKVSVSQQQIKALPSTGGVADIAQYLPVLPGVIVSGDQGGQLYIRGGSPIQNKILLDGMTIYNPFHSIGFFSVFETETIRSVDVLTGGFNAEYGGRISAIVDIKTREGNKKRLAGKVGVSPFQANAIIEGPIVKLNETEDGGSTSFLLTAKQSLLDRT
ncbi:MAG: carboxypeptidase-like regulatory domain-containing protein, partial [Saprospiraceae bacterium]